MLSLRIVFGQNDSVALARLLCRERRLGVQSWPRRWCELRGTDLNVFEGDGDIRAKLLPLAEFTLHTPRMPDAHRPFELVLVADAAQAPVSLRASFARAGFSARAKEPKETRKKRGTLGTLVGIVSGAPAAFYAVCAPDEAGFTAWAAAFGKVLPTASAEQTRGLAEVVGGWGGPSSTD